MYLRDEPTVATNIGVRDIMEGSTSNIKGVLADFLTPLLPKIIIEPSRDVLIELHQLLSSNAASFASNLGGGR